MGTEPREAGTRVLVIGGWGRCGSTLLDMLLGQLEGFVSAGEVRELWLHGLVEDRPCGCGESFRDCPFWTKVGAEAYGGWDRLDLDRVMRVRYSWDRAFSIPRLVKARRRELEDTDLAYYTDSLQRLLAAISSVSGGAVVIDSSKLPSHTMLLQRIPGLDLRLVHLVRDSRGVAYSNQKHDAKAAPAGESTRPPRYGPAMSALRYDLYNGVTTALGRGKTLPYLLLRYEDLIGQPEQQLRAILRHAGANSDQELSFLRNGAATLQTNHLVDGNPVRFTQGPLKLRLDDEWRRSLSARDRRTVTALTLPLLKRFRYPSAG
jgi:hypothetical protein